MWQQLNIYIGESDRWDNEPLYIALIELARQHGLAQGTAMRAMAGYSKHITIQTTHFLDLSTNLPVVVSIIDREEAISQFMPLVREMVKNGLITLQPLKIVHYAPISSD
ncbi:DUF190 domain-containing protein [Argonema antarcticum]|uniref:DUF190 domain-containing protein n=1 Tax=Argonema antarcticum TaxID=2942763 RepID=UPI00201323C4|nr:DUF190 domain-containing protein [Argonema antarcticum]MCL1473382.1 DUF190 domain-containing protein [Argonema antarcticum A004/B2]